MAQPPIRWMKRLVERGPHNVKAILARFTIAVMMLASAALTLTAGIRWD